MGAGGRRGVDRGGGATILRRVMTARPPRQRVLSVSTIGCGLLAACAWAPAPGEPPGAFVACVSPTTQSLRGLAAVDADCAWVGGSGGALFRTVDGGRSWADVAPPGCAQHDFRDIAAFDREVAVVLVAGQPAQLWRTPDGGRSWSLVLADERPAAFFDAIDCVGRRGVLFGDPVDGTFDVRVSDDAGVSWRVVPPARLPAPLPGESAFAASGSVVGLHADGGVWIATGGGPTRFLRVPAAAAAATAVALPLANGAPTRGAFAVAFRGDRGVAVGGDYAAPARADGTAACSEDGGRSWRAVYGGAGGFRSAVVWLDDHHTLAVGSHGASWSGDGGRSWQPLAGSFHTLARAADGTVWAAGADGRIARWRARRA